MKNFLEIRDEEMRLFAVNRQEEVHNRIESRLRTYELLGDIAELFFPKLADTVTVLLGGDVSDPETEYLTIKEGGWIGDEPPAGPGSQDEIIR